VVTPPQGYASPTPLEVALEVVTQIRRHPHAVPLQPGLRHWAMVEQQLRASDAPGTRVPAADHAALAIESGCDWSTTDTEFFRCAGLHARHPLRKALEAAAETSTILPASYSRPPHATKPKPGTGVFRGAGFSRVPEDRATRCGCLSLCHPCLRMDDQYGCGRPRGHGVPSKRRFFSSWPTMSPS
jgi:hypothetical protein